MKREVYNMKKILFVFLTMMSCAFLISCSLVGAQGPTGPEGPQGDVGPTGPQGVAGKDGTDGTDGKDGNTPYIKNGNWWIGNIDTGVKAAGTNGINGSDGKDGIDGEDGANGLDGKDGDTPYIKDGNWWIGDIDTGVKAAGTAGTNGADGSVWYFGNDDASSSIGCDNDFYLNNITWNVYKKINGEWQLVGNIKGQDGLDGSNGEQGINGINGATWIIEFSTPSSENGTNGDLFLNASTFDIYLKKDDIWVVIGNIKGQDAAHANEVLSVTFDVNGGLFQDDVNSSVEVTYGDTLDLPIPTRENYQFKGWFTGFSANDGQYTSITPVMNNITLYAKWEHNTQYTIYFETNGGNPIADGTYYADEEINLLPDALKVDKTFVAWYLDEELTKRVAYPLILTANITLYASYKDALYTVSFETNEGSSVDAQTVAPGTVIELPVCAKDDYVFVGWYKDEMLEIPAGNSLEVHANITLYAKWKIKNYTISYATDNGDFIKNSEYIIGTTIYELPVPNREDYIFKGWYLDDTLKNKVTYPFAIEEDMTVYAKWEANFIGISTYEQLVAISNMYSNYKLLCDIDCKGRDIKPIGSYDSPFRGKFNGMGYTISNYTITTVDEGKNSDGYNVVGSGLFVSSYGTIKNVKLKDFNIIIKDISTTGKSIFYFGSIVGMNLGNIEQCDVNGLLDINVITNSWNASSYCTSYLYIGGIAGISSLKISNSCFYGNIQSYSKAKYDYLKCYVGGIVGLANKSSFINKCITGYNATINTVPDGSSSSEYIGGICGYNEVDISQCLFLYGNLISNSSSNVKIKYITGCSQNGANARTNSVYYGPELTFESGTKISTSNANSASWYTSSYYLNLSADIWNLNDLNYADFKYPRLQ